MTDITAINAADEAPHVKHPDEATRTAMDTAIRAHSAINAARLVALAEPHLLVPGITLDRALIWLCGSREQHPTFAVVVHDTTLPIDNGGCVVMSVQRIAITTAEAKALQDIYDQFNSAPS